MAPCRENVVPPVLSPALGRQRRSVAHSVTDRAVGRGLRSRPSAEYALDEVSIKVPSAMLISASSGALPLGRLAALERASQSE